MAKKYTYTFKEIAEEVMRKLPGHYKNFDSANATVRTTARELGIKDINGKGHHKIVPAVHAELILKTVLDKATRRPYTPSTPIESAIREAEKEDVAVQSIKIEPAMKHAAQRTAELITKTGPFEKGEEFTKEELAQKCQKLEKELTAVEKKAIADDFELKRKRFYTDANYFLRMAQTPGERVAIWSALAKLYGIGGSINWDLSDSSVTMNPQKIPTETTEQRDKWSI